MKNWFKWSKAHTMQNLEGAGHYFGSYLTSTGSQQNLRMSLAGWLSSLEHHPVHQKACRFDSDSGHGTYLGCEFHPQSGYMQEARDQCFSLTLMLLSLSLSLSLPLPPSLSSINISLGEWQDGIIQIYV